MLKIQPTSQSLSQERANPERRLLIVDDEPSIIFTLKKLFEPLYTVETAESGAAALHILERSFHAHVILADQRMPGMTGAEFLAKSREILPHAVRIVLTGYTDVGDITDSINLGKVYSFFTKPWNNDDLKEAVRLAFEHYELSEEKTALERALAEVKALNEEKTEIMGIVSHDLKNPVGAIMGLSELIINAEEFGLAKEDYRRFGQEIHTASARVLALIKNLLDLNAVETGKIAVHHVPLNAPSIVQMIVEEYAERAADKNIRLFLQSHEECTLLADEIWFHQVLENLISNAVKYSPHGKNVFVEVAAKEATVRISIRDEGPGISPEDMKKLFGKFARLSAQPTGGEHSSGLGLSIVKKLVEAMNGKVWCESKLGEGATFIVEFPAA